MSYNKRKTTAIAIVIALLSVLLAGGCTQEGSSSEAVSPVENLSIAADSMDSGEMFTDSDKEIGYDESAAISIALSSDGIQSDSGSVKISGNTATITGGGTYLITGALENGQIIVDAAKTDKLQLVLNGVDLNCDTSAAIYVKQADKVFITLAEKTQNILSNKSEFVAIDENSIDSVIFSKDDLTINGTGALEINAVFGHGIVSKDDLVITGGTYQVTAENHALSGNDSIRIADGSFTISAGKDGIQAENSEDTSLGFVYISGGSFEITSACDGISASSTLQIDDGTINISSGGGSGNGEAKQEAAFSPRGQNSQTATDETDSVSTKGIKATGNLVIGGGEITIDSADDALHSNANLAIKNGTFTLSSGDDGIHADANTTVSGGAITVSKSYEGIEGQSIDIAGGIISVTASDDGLNAAGGNDQSGFGGGMRMDSFSADSDSYIKISGGTLNVDASGDGVDSNGALYVSGGESFVSGPTNSGNGALDYNGEAQISGGVFVAVGASGMAQNFGSSSTQAAMLVNLSASTAGTTLVLKDSSGDTMLSYTPPKEYSSALISSPQIKQGESYTLEAGSQSTEIEMTSLIYGSGGGMMGGQPDKGMGERPSGGIGEPPSGGMGKRPDETAQ